MTDEATRTRVSPGDAYGRLRVIEEMSERTSSGGRQFMCKCECGAVRAVSAKHLISGNTKSCGCLRADVARIHGYANRRHGQSSIGDGKRTRTYHTWRGMRQRCNDPNHVDYALYGGRGIGVCERWSSFENFLADMGERPEARSIDRIDPNGDYEPENCRWATATEQRANQRRCHA